MSFKRPQISFVHGATVQRIRRGRARAHPLAKTSGASRHKEFKFVDATAGLGRDALIIASVGASITMIERSKEVFDALTLALSEAKDAEPEVADAVSRMSLIYGDSCDLLAEMEPDVVLVDPMHPPRKASSLTKKDMRDLRQLVGDDPDRQKLMRAAISAARKRVVLKWPTGVQLIRCFSKPTFTHAGRTTCYHVFCRPD
ncbi:MAG: class I SAM-dependent methyltransferase [Hyphomicrobiaceae bacterium]